MCTDAGQWWSHAPLTINPGYLITYLPTPPDAAGSLLDKFVAVPAATRSGGIPATGWARVAMALQTLQGLPDAILLVDLADGGLIVVDWGRKDYWWQRSPAAFPTRPTISKIRVYREEGARLPFMLEQPAELSSLLWLVGVHAFPQSPAWWLAEGMSYQLSRWPDFTVLTHATEHVSMTALLARRAYSPAELALAAGVDLAVAQSFVNALSLMGLLRESVSAPAPVVETAAPGLFARLRARLGV